MHSIQAIRFDKNFMYLNIDEQMLIVNVEAISKKLNTADFHQKMTCKISPSGYGIHWPLIDEDLSVDAILKSVK